MANEPGAHRLVNEYAAIVLRTTITADDLAALDEPRRDRHTAEYGDFASRVIDSDRARLAAELATRVVNAIARELAENEK